MHTAQPPLGQLQWMREYRAGADFQAGTPWQLVLPSAASIDPLTWHLLTEVSGECVAVQVI